MVRSPPSEAPVPDLTLAADAEIALALSRLPLARLETVARLLLARLDASARQRVALALAGIPAAAGEAAKSAVETFLRRTLAGEPRSR